MTPHYRGPYKIAATPGPDNTDHLFRHVDGALIIMGQDAEGSPAPVLQVPMRALPRRGERWKTHDPDQEAFAAALVDLLNHAHDNG